MPSKVANRSRGRARGAARLYGREDERAVLGAFLEQVRKAQSGALVLRGPAGIGKSALIADTVARANGFRIIAAEGAEPESGLAFASRRVGNWRSSSWRCRWRTCASEIGGFADARLTRCQYIYDAWVGNETRVVTLEV